MLAPLPSPRPTLAQVRSLARQLPPASRSKLLADLYAAEALADVRDIRAIARAVRADAAARNLSPITDEDIARELTEHRAERAA